MKVLAFVPALLAVSAAQWLGNAGLGYAGMGYAGMGYAGMGYAGMGMGVMPYAAGIAPMPIAPMPAVTSHQFHSQDELGQYKYGYSSLLSSKVESKNAFGGTVGAYNYIDANGIQQTVKYVADAGGFRVEATNLPVAPVANLKAPVMTLQAPVMTLVGPQPVDDTPEVKAAKAEFRKLFTEAAVKAENAPGIRRRRSLLMPVAPQDTPAVMLAKAQHAALYNAAALRAAGMPSTLPVPVLLDTPAVAAAKMQHAFLYNRAALRAAAAPDFGPYGAWKGLGMLGFSGNGWM